MEKEEKLILVIDDEIAICELIYAGLRAAGYRCIVSTDSTSSLALVESTPNLVMVITDIVMPKKEGLELIQEFRSRFPALKIIAMSGANQGAENLYLEPAAKFGADLSLAKPIKIMELIEHVRVFLGD